jgi:OmcA/MtrC family decaheme c-type cytochrome
MNNCANCHRDPAALATVNSEPVSYDFCFSCHGGWTAWNHGDTNFGTAPNQVDHAGFTAATNCAGCHDGVTAGDTITDFHNNLQTGRSGVIFNGQDTSIVEGAKVDMQITNVARSGANLLVSWTAEFDGTPVSPCNAVAGTTTPAFYAAAANATTGQVAGGFSILRAYAQGDDFINPGIGTAPGQPVSTNLSGTNTNCTADPLVAVTTVALSTAEQAMTRGRVAIQGKAQLDLSVSFPGIDTATATAGTQVVDQVRSKTPTREFLVADGALPLDVRRGIVDTDSCLKCHPGSLYQHGGNRIDNVDLCVMCHNEASSDQNNRVFDGVDATEAYDQKPGQSYGFKSLLHAVHSAGNNNAVTMNYRTMGNYVWSGETSVIPNYPTTDYAGNPLESGALALIYGSSAPHGTGAVIDGPLNSVYRVHNLHHTTYPQQLKNCASCHVPGSFGFPDPTKAMATTVDVGGVKADQTSASDAVYGVQTDDVLKGTSAAACFSCHQGDMAPFAAHGNAGGFAPTAFPGGRADVPAESCTTCHQE